MSRPETLLLKFSLYLAYHKDTNVRQFLYVTIYSIFEEFTLFFTVKGVFVFYKVLVFVIK